MESLTTHELERCERRACFIVNSVQFRLQASTTDVSDIENNPGSEYERQRILQAKGRLSRLEVTDASKFHTNGVMRNIISSHGKSRVSEMYIGSGISKWGVQAMKTRRPYLQSRCLSREDEYLRKYLE